jgi:hypothetical protein
LVVVPGSTADGKVRLHFVPQIEYGEKVPRFHPAEDGSGWVYEYDMPRKSFPALGWDVILAPNQYVLVGTRFDHHRSLGFASFVQADGGGSVQRLLVIRTSRPGMSPELAGNEDADETMCSKGPAPLALQAQAPCLTARGRGP